MRTFPTAASDDARTTLEAIPAWLVQFDPFEAEELKNDWRNGQQFAYPAVNRNTHAIAAGDLVYFWVYGLEGASGIYGVGVATGRVMQRPHAKNYRDPDGPRALRDSVEVDLDRFLREPILTRIEMKADPVFAAFDLFKMPNRPNAFTVTREESAVVLARMEQVMGR